MKDEYDTDYREGLKEGIFRGNLRALQVGLTALVTVEGLSFFGNSDITDNTSLDKSQAIRDVTRVVPYTPELFDENEPHKYNPKPSNFP